MSTNILLLPFVFPTYVPLFVAASWSIYSLRHLLQTLNCSRSLAHGTSRGIQIDNINIDVEGDVDLCGFTGISNDVRPGAQQFRVNMNIKSKPHQKSK